MSYLGCRLPNGFFGLVGVLTLVIFPVHAPQVPATQSLPYMNLALQLEKRVDDLIGRMTAGCASRASTIAE